LLGFRAATARRRNTHQYGGETGITAISQNFFVSRFATTLFSQNAAE
jgi:hypothetical protein